MDFAEISVVANPGYHTFAPGSGTNPTPPAGTINGFQSFTPAPPYVTQSEAPYFDSDINVAHAPGIVSMCIYAGNQNAEEILYPRGSVVTVKESGAAPKARQRHPQKELCHTVMLSCGCTSEKSSHLTSVQLTDMDQPPIGVLAEAVRLKKGEHKVVSVAVKGASDVVLDCTSAACDVLKFVPGRTYPIGPNGISPQTPGDVKFASECKLLVAPSRGDKTLNVYIL